MKLFQRKKENFTCGHCGFFVIGNGYTNHCPKCLYSKHVDVNPGDRQEICQGLMQPIEIEIDHSEQVLVHKCLECRIVRKNKTASEDDIDQIVKLKTA